MDDERWKRIEGLFEAALKQSFSDRPAFLTRACGHDETLLAEVESLLVAHEKSGGLLEGGLTGLVGEIVHPEEPGALAGRMLGSYQLMSLLGQGGMGEVYLARDVRLDRQVAIKFLLPSVTNHSRQLRRFEAEARAASALNHPNVVTVFDIGSYQDRAFLVTEYVEGETLRERMRTKPAELGEVLAVAIQVASALAEAHASGIVHRDIKPENIVVRRDGLVKVLDFGLAKLLEARKGEGITDTGTVMGTPHYMSPEQARGESVDGRSDIFSLGAVVYEMITGGKAFSGETLGDILVSILERQPLPMRTRAAGLPQRLERTIEKSLEKKRELRHGSAKELLEELRQITADLTSQDTAACGVAAAPRVKREQQALVGRDVEMRSLKDLFDEAASGAGSVALITGEAGIGKSAIANAFLSSVRHQLNVLIGFGACVEQYGAGEAYLPFLDALAHLLTGSGKDTVLAVLRRFAPTWCLQFPAAFHSSGALDQLQRETIGANKDRMLRELGDALGELASTFVVVLLLEDLHWADRSSIDLLRHLGDRASGHRLLLIGTARPGDVERTNHPLRNCKRELQAHSACHEIAVPELSREYISRYLDARFYPNDFPPEFALLIHRKTEGHPLFTTGALQLLVERGEIQVANDLWTLAHPVAALELEVPETIRGMILKQLEMLDEEDRRTLQYASVEGEEFTSTVLAALLDTDELALQERLDILERVHRLIRTLGEEELPDGSAATRYVFAHGLYQNLLYAGLVPKRRVFLHRAAGEALLRCYAGQTPRVAAPLATHFERGKDYSRAITYLIETAGVAGSRYANGEAEDRLSHALTLADRTTTGNQQLRLKATLLHKRGTVRLALARYDDALLDLTAALQQARAIGDPMLECGVLSAMADAQFYAHYIEELGDTARRSMEIADRLQNPSLRAKAFVDRGRYHQVVGQLQYARASYDQSIPIARSAEDRQTLSVALGNRGQLHFFQSEYQQAEEVLREAVQVASEIRDGVNLPQMLFMQGLTLGNQGRITEALAKLNEAQEMSLRNGGRMVASKIPNSIGWLHRELQDFDGALQWDVRALETSRTYRITEAEANALINLVHDYADRGEVDRAVEAIEAVQAIRDRDAWHAWRFFEIRFQVAIAEHWLWRGEPERAATHARLLLSNAVRQWTPKYIAIAHRLLAEIAIASGDYLGAKDELHASLEQLRSHPNPLVAWRVYVLLGRVAHHRGELELGHEAFSEAAVLVQEIAGSTIDQNLRTTFLNCSAMSEILRGTS